MTLEEVDKTIAEFAGEDKGYVFSIKKCYRTSPTKDNMFGELLFPFHKSLDCLVYPVEKLMIENNIAVSFIKCHMVSEKRISYNGMIERAGSDPEHIFLDKDKPSEALAEVLAKAIKELKK